TFWGWLVQILSGNSSCASAVTNVQGWFKENALKIPSANNGAFCRARARLSDEFLDEVESMCETHSRNHEQEWQLWRGLRAKAIDGTSFKLDDTPENQAEYPQPSGQKPGCGFPVMGVVGVLDLATGRLVGSVAGRDRRHDACGLYQLMGCFGTGDLAVADRAFSGYELIGLLKLRGAHSIMRLHQQREAKLDWRKGRKLSLNSRLVVWKRPRKPGKCGITFEEWDALPEELEVRLVRIRGKDRHGKARTIYLATTLIDDDEYPEDEVAGVYAQRWDIEVRFRDIKTTLGFEHLRVKSPAMARKTLRMIILAYNLIKALQIEAAEVSDHLPTEFGFQGTLDVILETRTYFRGLQNKPRKLREEMNFLVARIVERFIRARPGRTEPRAIKRRPKCYQYLTSPRDAFREILHREHYYALA
ncbi:MAG: IS4 family transposase, partial [Verrucomicrobiota bacterium]